MNLRNKKRFLWSTVEENCEVIEVLKLKGTYKELNEMRKRIEAWQDYEFVHPLTCGNNSLHADLVPQLELEKDEFELCLVCRDCSYKQDVPSFFIDYKDKM